MMTNTFEEEEERTCFLDTPVCCLKYDGSDIHNIDYEFDKCFGDKPYLKILLHMDKFTKNQVKTLNTLTRFSICEAIVYVSSCHCCGATLEYGEDTELLELTKQLVCSKECETKMRNKETKCYFGESCNMCNLSSNAEKCDCYICNIDGDDEVNHFNRLHDTCFDSDGYEKLKKYAKTNMITMRDAISYSQSCHACNYYYLDCGECSMYGDTYCCEECETKIELNQELCFSNECNMECKICSNPDKTLAFNTRYNVDFDDEIISKVKGYAKKYDMNVKDAIEYYLYLNHDKKDDADDDEILLTTEDAGILEEEEDIMPPLSKATVDNVLLAKKLLPEELTLSNFNIAGPSKQRGMLDSETWDEIEDTDGSIFYMRKGFYRLVYPGPPAPRDNLEWYEIGDNFYVVKKV